MKKFIRMVCILLLFCAVLAACNDAGDLLPGGSGTLPALAAPSAVWIEDGYLCWNAVEFATRYTVSIDGKEEFCDDIKFSLAEISDGDHAFAVKANADGTTYSSSAFTEPLNVKLTGGAITLEGAYSQFEDLSESYLGYGFDVIRSSVFSDKYVKLSAPIFTAEGIKNQRLLRVDSKYSYVDEIVSSSMEEFSQKWNASANIGVKWGKKSLGGSVELSAKYSNENKNAKTLSYQCISITNQQFYVVMQSDLATYRSIMTDAFKADLYSDMSPATFFDRYGTHFITSAVMGGKINSYYMHSSESEQSLSKASAKASTEVRAWKTQVDADLSVSWREEMASQGIDITNTLEVLGGGDFGMLNATDVPENYAAWEKSLNTDPSIIGIKDTGSLWGVWELIDPSLDTEETYTWIDENGEEQHGTRSAQLQAYFYQYGVEAYNELLEASGLPEIIVPTGITNIRVNGSTAEGGEYIVYAGVENDISFTVLPQNAVGYTKSIAISGVCDYASVNEQNQLVIHANAPANGLVTVVVSAGGVRQQIQVRVRQTYMVEFQPSYPEDGDWDPIAPKTNVLYNNTITKPIVQNVPGYIFLGWYVNGEIDKPWNFLQDRVKENMILIGAWAEFNPTITFVDNYNTNSIAAVKIPYNTAFSRPADPVLAGYTFGGFYSGSDMVREFDFTKQITEDTVIYVKWNKNPTVTFYSSVAGYTKDPVKVTYNTALTMPATPILSGYTFDGWYADSSFETKFDFSKKLTEDVTIYAFWYRNPTVTFYSNADGFVKDSEQVRYNETLTVPATPVLSGYSFGGWYSDFALETPFDFSQKLTKDTVIYVKWNKNPTVSFASATAGFSMQSVRVTYNTCLEDVTDPVLAHHDFGGWYTDAACTAAFDFAQKITANMTLYAKFTPVNYTVSYNSNGGSTVAAQTVPYGSPMPMPTDPAKNDFWFAGWYHDTALQSMVDFSTDKVTGNVTLYAKWTDKLMFTVSFETNGGEVLNDIYVQEGSQEVTVLPTPVRVGYTFMGWYSDEALTEGNKVTDRVFTQNTTLWAKWSVNSYTVTYIAGDYTLPQNATKDYTVESVILVPDVEHAIYPTHYRFDGWYEDAAFNKAFMNDLKTNPRNVTLYAKLTPFTYKISYEAGNATLSGNYTKEYTIETVDDVVLPTVQHMLYPTHYSMRGWYEDATFTDEFANDLKTNPRNIVLYPQLVAVSYNITYHFDGTATNEYTTTYIINQHITLPDLIFEGHKMQGWYTNAEMTDAFINDLSSNPRNIHLYAKWENLMIDVLFNENGGTSVSDQKFEFGKQYGTLPEPSRTGFDFLGWYTSEGDGNLISNTTVVTVAETHTLYAHWKPKTYTISFDANGGSVATKQTTVDYKAKYNQNGALPIPTREGYAFGGWYTAASGGNKVTDATEMSVTANHTLYAQWLYLQDSWVSGDRDRQVTDHNGVYDSITLGRLDVAKLKDLGYKYVYIHVRIDAKEEINGYQHFWICNATGGRLLETRFEHGGGLRKESWGTHTFGLTLNLADVLNDNGQFKVEYGASGSGSDNWRIGYTTFTVTVSK